MLVHDHVCTFRDLDRTIWQLLYCTPFNELSEDICSILVVLSLLFSSSQLYFQVLYLDSVIFFHLLNQELLITDIL